jgi:hypothetical protein
MPMPRAAQAFAVCRDFLAFWKDADPSIRLLKGGVREIAVAALLLLGRLDWRSRVI